MESQPIGRVVLSEEAIPFAKLQTTAFYDGILRPQDIGYNGMIALAAREDFRAAFNMCRGARRGTLTQPRARPSLPG